MLVLVFSFWVCLATVVYIYVGYPLFIYLLGKLYKKDVEKQDHEPPVSILIAAFNEEKDVANTIENKLQLDYPSDLLEIIVISDESFDGTDSIVQGYVEKYPGRIRFLRQVPRNGKTSALNMGVPAARGDLIVFSDANSIYEKDALRKLVRNFSEDSIGYVTGKMIYANSQGTVIGDGCSAYMKYENFLRKHETKVGSVVGVDGGIDVIRKSLYETMRPDQIPDFVLPLKVIRQGYRVVYESGAILKEEALATREDEYKMRARVSLRALWALTDMSLLFNIGKYGIFSWQLFSHKVLRYLAFIFLIALFFINIAIVSQSVLYSWILFLQSVFYAGAFVGYVFEKHGVKSRIFYIPYYFSLINVASLVAFIKYMKGEKQVIWNPRVG